MLQTRKFEIPLAKMTCRFRRRRIIAALYPIVRGSLVSRQEALRRSREVSADDVAAVAAELARAQRSRVTVGPSQ